MRDEFKWTDLTDIKLDGLATKHDITHAKQELILLYLKKIAEYMKQMEKERAESVAWSQN